MTENKTPAANLHRKTRLLAKCRESGGRSHSALLENREEEGILSRAGWGRCSGILNAVAMMSEIRGCQKDNCAPEQPKGVARQKRRVESMGDPMGRGSGAYLKETVTYCVSS